MGWWLMAPSKLPEPMLTHHQRSVAFIPYGGPHCTKFRKLDPIIEDLRNVRSRYTGHGYVITPHTSHGMELLMHTLDACFWHRIPQLNGCIMKFQSLSAERINNINRLQSKGHHIHAKFINSPPPPPPKKKKKKKANLRDLIAATGLVILLKFDPNHRFFVPCDLEIWWMALENNRAPLLYYIKLCASFQIHRWIQIGITVRKR